MSVKARNQQEALLTKARAQRLLLDLEKLKSDISSIENRYSILSKDYTAICEDAISRLNSLQTELDKPGEKDKNDHEELKKRIQNLEARFRLGLITQETYLHQKQKLILRNPTSTGVQLYIDKTAGGIEYGLDKLGDILTFPILLATKLCQCLLRSIGQLTHIKSH